VMPTDTERWPHQNRLLSLRICASVRAMRLRIPGLKKYQGRNPNGYFQDLDWPTRQRAYAWLHHLCEKGQQRRRSVPRWLFAIYVGQAKRLALNPPTYEWSRWMNAKKGGYAVQRKYLLEGRHPTEKATQARLAALKARKEAAERQRLGLPPPSRHRSTWGNKP
jgi:hypothetical protein